MFNTGQHPSQALPGLYSPHDAPLDRLPCVNSFRLRAGYRGPAMWNLGGHYAHALLPDTLCVPLSHVLGCGTGVTPSSPLLGLLSRATSRLRFHFSAAATLGSWPKSASASTDT